MAEANKPRPPDYTSSDPYKCLGLPPTSSLADAQARFKELALKYHPDKHNDNPSLATEMFCAFRGAFEYIRARAVNV